MTDHNIKLIGDHIDERDLILPVLIDFARRAGKNVVVKNPHNESHPPYIGDVYDLAIFFWSVPSFRMRSDGYPVVWGQELRNGQGDGCLFSPSSEYFESRRPFFDDLGLEIASLVGKTLYIYFDLPHSGGTRPDYLLAKILSDLELYYLDAKAFGEEMTKRTQNVDAMKFESAVIRAVENATGLDELENIDDEINGLRQKLTLLLIRQSKTVAWRTDRRKNPEKARESMRRTFESLKRLSVTGQIKINNYLITVPVGQIDITFKGKVYDIGTFDVVINVAKAEISCINKTRSSANGFYHPHVDNDGDCCFGNASAGIAALMSRMELDVVVLMTIEFLQSYNPDGCYVNISKFPVKEVLFEEPTEETGEE